MLLSSNIFSTGAPLESYNVSPNEDLSDSYLDLWYLNLLVLSDTAQRAFGTRLGSVNALPIVFVRDPQVGDTVRCLSLSPSTQESVEVTLAVRIMLTRMGFAWYRYLVALDFELVCS